MRLQAKNPAIEARPVLEAIRSSGVVFLATPFQANADIVEKYRASFAGKIVVDCTNPVGPGLSHGLGSAQSGSAWLQDKLPAAKIIKAFSVYGFENFSYPNPHLVGDRRAAMFFCGDDLAAKAVVGELITKLGWEPLDVGGIVQALHLEHMTLMWIRMVRVHNKSPLTAWSQSVGSARD